MNPIELVSIRRELVEKIVIIVLSISVTQSEIQKIIEIQRAGRDVSIVDDLTEIVLARLRLVVESERGVLLLVARAKPTELFDRNNR